jgi:predicted outer membrane repeat protein
VEVPVRADPAGLPVLVAALVAHTALFALAGTAEGARILVPRTHRTVQAGIDAASSGDTVFVAPGTYPGTLSIRKNIVLFGAQGADTTILDGGDAARVIHVEGVSGGGVVGFTIRRGRANSGGGIQCVRATAFLVAGCIFEKNWESAVSLWQSQNVDVRDCRFVENDGSAIAMNESTGLIRSCEFLRNRGYAGGAISLTGSRLLFPMRGCNFEGNHAEGASGGAIFADSSEVVVVEGWFEKNTARLAGGAIAVVREGRASLSRNRFLENEAPSSGAVHVDRATLIAGLNVFDKNKATSGLGAAIGVVRRAGSGVNPLIQNNTFYRNTSNEGGATIWAEQVSPEIGKNIFDMAPKERAFRGVSSTPLFECNLIHDPSGAALASLPSVDTLVGNPLFCDEANGDYYLRDLSPAVLASCGPIGALPKKCASFKMVPSR